MIETILAVIANTSPLEWAANITTAICIFLAGRNNVHTWWTGIVACILFMFLFYDMKLYADAKLQVFFAITGIIGWYSWIKTRTKPALDITSVVWAQVRLPIFISGIVYIIYATMLHTYTTAYAPFWDSAILILSVNAQLLLMRRHIQTWPLWLVVNTIAVPLFASRELYLTSFMYGLFWLNAAYSWWYWKQLTTRAPDMVSST